MFGLKVWKRLLSSRPRPCIESWYGVQLHPI